MTDTPADRARDALGMGTARREPGKELDPVNRVGAQLMTMREQYQLAMPRGLEAQQLIRDAVTALRTNPKLMECFHRNGDGVDNSATFYGALMTAAQLGLRPNVPALQHGWVLPFRNNRRQVMDAVWIMGYQGMIELAHRSQLVSEIRSHTIYANEDFEIEYGLEDKLVHRPRFDSDRGEAILYYAVGRMTNGGRVFHVMGRDDVERIRQFSKSARMADSPWNTDYDGMARKSTVRQLFKYLPKSTLLAQALASDEAVRVDLAQDAIDSFDGTQVGSPTQEGSITVERAQADAAAEHAEASQAEPEPEQVARETVQAPLDKPRNTALRKGLLAEVQQRHGTDFPNVMREVVGSERGLDWVTTDELKTMLRVTPRDATAGKPTVMDPPAGAEAKQADWERSMDAAYERDTDPES